MDRQRNRVVSKTMLGAMAVVWVASLVMFPILTWHGMILYASAAGGVSVTIPLIGVIALSGTLIHRQTAHSLDSVIRVLLALSVTAAGFSKRLQQHPRIGRAVSAALKLSFFCWFMALMAADKLLRRVLVRLSGTHIATGRHYSLVNAPDPTFQPAGVFDREEDIDDGESEKPAPVPLTESLILDSQEPLRKHGIPFRPKTAYSLGVAAKLSYEDLDIVKHELEAAGYDMDTFSPIHFRNTCGFAVAKGKTIVVVFRGTQPLNLSNVITDIRGEMVSAAEATSKVDVGRVHSGFLEALGPVEADEELEQESLFPLSPSQTSRGLEERRQLRRLGTGKSSRVLRVELEMHSFTQAVASAMRALAAVVRFLVANVARHVADPIARYTAVDNRDESAYVQAHRAIAHCIHEIRLRESIPGVIRAHQKDLELRASPTRTEPLYRKPADGTATDNIVRRALARAAGPLDDCDGDDQVTSDDDRSATKLFGYNTSNRPSTRSSETLVDELEPPSLVDNEKIRIYIAGHSLGAAIATLFLAKLTECESSFLDYFDGLYLFGCPRVGDQGFQDFVSCQHKNVFRVVYNKDLVPRVPPLPSFAEVPGHGITLAPSGKMVVRRPGSITRPISFLSPAGLLSPTVIFQLRNESFLRLLYRVVLPFFVNDHLPCDYVNALQRYAY